MSMFQDFIAKISSRLFYSHEEKNNTKIIPKMEFEDAELGNIITQTFETYNKEGCTLDCEFKSIIQNPDLELGFGPIVEISCNDIIVDMKAFEKCKIYENYKSFIDSIIYLTTPFKDRSHVFFIDVYPLWNRQLINNDFHVVMHIESASMGVRLNKAVV